MHLRMGQCCVTLRAGPTMLGVVESMLVVVCKRMQQLPTVLGLVVHRLWRACVMRVRGRNMEELCKSLLRYASAITEQKNVGSCWFKSLTGFKLCATTPNNKQQSVQTDATCNIQRRWELLANNRELKQRRRGRQRERQKISKPTTFHVHHAFLYISLPTTTTTWDCLIYVLWRTRHKKTNLFFFSWTLIQFSSIQLPKN